jgi:hypothetical protein
MQTQAAPQVVVAPGADGPAVGVPQQRTAARARPGFPVGEQVRHQRGGHGLPADRLAFLVQPDEAVLGVEVTGQQRQGAAATAGGLGMQPQQQRVQGRVIPGGRGDAMDLFQAAAGQGPARTGQPPRLGHAGGGVLAFGQDAVSDRMLVHAPEGGDQVLGRAAAATGISSLNDRRFDLLGKLADLRGGRLSDGPGAPRPGLRGSSRSRRPGAFRC